MLYSLYLPFMKKLKKVHFTNIYMMKFYRYGMRYMAKVLKAALEQKFPEAAEKDVLKVRRLWESGMTWTSRSKGISHGIYCYIIQ